jgi:Tfp pilus assembly protein PilO
MKFLQDIPKEKLQKIILVAIIGLGVTIAVFIFYVNKQLDALREAAPQTAGLHNQIAEAEKEAKANRQLEQQRAAIVQLADAQRAVMVTGDSLSWTIRAIGDLAEKHPVHISGWRPAGKTNNRINSRYEAFTMQLEIEGDYDALGRFIEALENKFATGEIRQMEMINPGSSDTQRRVNLSISIPILPEKHRPPTPAPVGTEAKQTT